MTATARSAAAGGDAFLREPPRIRGEELRRRERVQPRVVVGGDQVQRAAVQPADHERPVGRARGRCRRRSGPRSGRAPRAVRRGRPAPAPRAGASSPPRAPRRLPREELRGQTFGENHPLSSRWVVPRSRVPGCAIWPPWATPASRQPAEPAHARPALHHVASSPMLHASPESAAASQGAPGRAPAQTISWNYSSDLRARCPPPGSTSSREFLRIPSVSADPAHAGGRAARGRMGLRLRPRRGRRLRRSSTGTGSRSPSARSPPRGGARGADGALLRPFRRSAARPARAVGERRRSSRRSAASTCTARGTVDDKGQLYMLLAAARELALPGELPVNVRFCCDGEEETGGHSIVEFLVADERGADAAIIFDSGMIRRGLPAFNLATRGHGLLPPEAADRRRRPALGRVRRRGAERRACARRDAVSRLIARDGRLAEPLRRGAVPPTDEELAGWAELPAGRRRARRAGRAPDRPARGRGVLPADVRRAGARRERDRERLAAPAEDGAAGRGGREPLDPARARAAGRGDRRRASSGCCARPRPTGRDARDRAAGRRRRPGSSRRTRKRCSSGSTRSSASLGRRPALIRTGGTLPIVPALADKGIPTIITGFGLPDSNMHSPNERLLAEYVPLGIAAARELLPRRSPAL